MALLLNAGDTVSRSYSYTQPSPLHPSQPQGTGERTWNLINVAYLSGVRWATQYPALLNAINSLPNGVYTMSISYELTSRNDTTDSSVCGWHIAKDGRALSNVRNSWETAQIGDIITAVDTFTIDDNNRGAFTSLYLYGCGINGVGPTGTAIATNMMLNTGSTALPYEPYGHKLDISCGDTVTPIYLGETQSTRRIKKLVLTGEENFVYDSNYTRFRFTMPNSLIIGVRRTPVICTHYEALTGGRPIEEVINNTIYSDSARQDRWWIEDERFSSADDFKAYLAEQYAAGTPVTIWYILTEPQTAIVNEPLMKIGDYADEIINVNVPTIVGTNVFNVDTTLKPSEVTLHYHGWHPINNVHEYDNGEWN